MTNLFQPLRVFRAKGDKFTLKALWLWMTDYHDGEPQMAVNDNNPNVNPMQIETRIDAVSAEKLILSMEEDEKVKLDPTFKRTTPPYSESLHAERFERVKHAKKSAPPLPEYVDAEAEMARYLDAKRMREWLGADADVLDMAVETHTTLHDIGLHIGAEGDHAAVSDAGEQEVRDVAKVFYDKAA